jgi:hypothetical protein
MIIHALAISLSATRGRTDHCYTFFQMNDLTSCSIMSNLPIPASLATLGYEAIGTGLPKVSSILVGVGLNGMVKLTELPLTYRHARKCESY